MSTNTIMIFCNLIPALLILFYLFDGWNKGAIYMLVALIRLIASYFIARFFSTIIADTFMSLQITRSQISSIALEQQEALTSIPGASYLLTGDNLQATMETVSWWLFYVISFAIIFMVLMVFFSALLRVSKMMNKIPMVGWFNKLLGAIEGLVFGATFTLVLVYLVAFVLEICGETELRSVLMGSWVPVTFEYILKHYIQ